MTTIINILLIIAIITVTLPIALIIIKIWWKGVKTIQKHLEEKLLKLCNFQLKKPDKAINKKENEQNGTTDRKALQ